VRVVLGEWASSGGRHPPSTRQLFGCAEAYCPLFCRGPVYLNVQVEHNFQVYSILFLRNKTAAGPLTPFDPLPGKTLDAGSCAWADCPVRNNEPTALLAWEIHDGTAVMAPSAPRGSRNEWMVLDMSRGRPRPRLRVRQGMQRVGDPSVRGPQWRHCGVKGTGGADGPSDQLVAATARAIRRQVDSQGNVAGRCKTIRRAERSTHTASLSSRSRSVVTCASAQTVPAARRRSSWNSRYAGSWSDPAPGRDAVP
jgi:hypothetical protein